MKPAKLSLIFLVILSGLLVRVVSTTAQAIRRTVVNVWDYYDSDDSQTVVFYSDSSYVLYWSHDSLEDNLNQNCQTRVIASQGTAMFSGTMATLTQAQVYQIDYPDCSRQYTGGSVLRLTPQQVNVTVELTGYGTLVLSGVAHLGYLTERTLQPVPDSGDSLLPSGLVGHWSYLAASQSGMLATVDLTLFPDGTFIEEILFYAESIDCTTTANTAGHVQIDGLILLLEPVTREQTDCDGQPTTSDLAVEQHVWWLVHDSQDGLLLYLDGSRYTLVSTSVQPAPAVTPEPATTVESAAPENRRTLFADDFSDNSADWETGSGDGYVTDVADGVYRMDFAENASSTHWIVAPGFTDASLAPGFIAPFNYEIDVRGSCSIYCGVGLLFGVQPGYSDVLEMMYLYTSFGVGIYELRDLGSLSETNVVLESGIALNAINLFDGQTHRLRLNVENSHVAFSIDGRPIGETQGDWETAGSIGFAMQREAGSQLYLEFDNVHVTQ